jgi:nucleotide-binding universal stress UspA family protein
MKIDKLLFVTEFEQLWFDAVQSLMDLKKAGLKHVVFLHVIDRDKVAMHRGVGYLKSEAVKLKEMANVRFIDWAESLFEQGMEVGAHIVVGNLVQKIVTIAEEENVDLIITGCQKKGKMKDLFAGSEIMEVLRRSSKPVLVLKYVPESGKINEQLFKRPLLATDWSPASKAAIKLLTCLKDVIEEVQVIHVASEKSVEGTSAMGVQKIRKENRKKMEEDCEFLRSEGINAEQHLYIGDAVSQIEKAAKERNATMIVTGTTGKGPWRERWLGSVPRELAEESTLTTLVVPPDRED